MVLSFVIGLIPSFFGIAGDLVECELSGILVHFSGNFRFGVDRK